MTAMGGKRTIKSQDIGMKSGTQKAISGPLALFLMLAGCQDVKEERQAHQSQSLDGGYTLSRSHGAEGDKIMADDPCWRREKGGWHLSVGHCEEMLPPGTVSGVWITGFEESSFFPGATVLPDRNDERRFRIDLEVDPEHIARLLDRKLEGPEYHGIALTLVGQRTKYPVAIDCYGGRHYAFVAGRVKKARYLGIMANPDRPPLPSERPPYEPFKRSGEGGVIAEMEEETLANCLPRLGGS